MNNYFYCYKDLNVNFVNVFILNSMINRYCGLGHTIAEQCFSLKIFVVIILK